MDKNLWWGYKHVSGTYQAKRYFKRDDVLDAYESPFVETVVNQFQAKDRNEAIEYIKKQTN